MGVLAAPLIALALVASGGSQPPPDAGHARLRPAIRNDLIAFPKSRKRETASYSKRHYGHREWRLRNPKVIVLHFTGSDDWRSARSTFAADTPSLGELPGVCAHFIVDQQGTIHRIVPTAIRCRHTIGLNYTAIGVEMAQSSPSGSHEADVAILHRRPQIRAAVRLVAWLSRRYDVPLHEVIGHSMANDDKHFRDLEGWRNDHTDWLREDVQRFRARVRKRFGAQLG